MTVAARTEGIGLSALDGAGVAEVRPHGPSSGVGHCAPNGPVWFGPEGEELFGWVHRPASARPATGSVVLCPPLFGEEVPTHHAYLALAGELAAAGLVAVRFDYQGTGDAAGPTDAPGLAERWVADVERAVALARSCAPGPVALVGIRLGALLAAVAAARGADVDALVLWDPCLSGRSFLRRMQSLLSLHFEAGSTRSGLVEVPGAGLSTETASGIVALRLPPFAPGRRTLVLLRPGERLPGVEPGSETVVDGVDLVRLDEGEQEAFLEVAPERSRLSTSRVTAVRDWLVGAMEVQSGAARPDDDRGRAPATVNGPSTVVPPAARPPDVRSGDRPVNLPVEVDGSGHRVQERCLRVGPLGLFAIETAPAPIGEDAAGTGRRADAPHRRVGPAQAAAPVVLFCSSGGTTHVGPNRMWVSLARRWAALGVRCVRMDESGWGESPVRPGQRPRVVRPPEAFDDVAMVAAAIDADPRQLVLVGLCSGAYQAIESALELSPLGVLAVNVGLWFTPPEVKAGGPVSPRRRVHMHRPPWMGKVHSRLPGALGGAARRVGRWWWRTRRPAAEGRSWRDDLVCQGVHVVCVGGDEGESGVLARDLRQTPPRRTGPGSFDVELIEGLDHGLSSERDREQVTDRLTDRLLHLFAGH